MGHYWLDDGVCFTFQPKIIWQDAILDMVRSNHEGFISVYKLKTQLKDSKTSNLNCHPINDVP